MEHPGSRHTKALTRNLPRRADVQVASRQPFRRSGNRTAKAGSAWFWTAEEERLLAQTMKEPRDPHATRELAKRLGRSQLAVENHRRARFGRVQPAPRPWTPREDRLLGTRTDEAVARLTDRHWGTVAARRRRLGIPATVERRPWTPKEDRLLGTASDEALSKKLGRLRSTIGMRRNKLGIRRYPRPGAYTPEEDRLLGTMSDPEAARRLGRTLASVQQRRRVKKVPSAIPCKPWSPSEDALLGTMSDQEISRKLGRGICGVLRRRRIYILS